MIDWENLRQECIRSGKIIKVRREEALPLPPSCHETNLGLSKGAIRQYRDKRPTHSLHIHEFPDYFLVHTDAFNAEFHPVVHGVVDTPGITLAVIGGAVATFWLFNTIRHLSFLPADYDGTSNYGDT